ncbi:MAG: hypothetical protein LPJ89_09525 [Hymenobacteraceae bacterium]|nr:hypothetical protein [Hymenobacteraceae bacterium]MDX5394629.1 hypothetical protein [Hymenobacteraceae bacterium]MDX5444005.1 hypothetical protein [Hymenobacteraceae bacterium]MDX5510660.1 hypothetical protein [Hymenobacteraceae bacterium]
MNRLQKYPRLLPHRYKKIGLWIALSGIAYIVFIISLKIAFNIQAPGSLNVHENIACILQIVGLCMRSLSKEKTEDELMMQLRLRSLSGALFGAAGVALVATIYDMTGNSFDWSIPFLVIWLLWTEQFFFWQSKKQFFKQSS